MKIKIPKKPKKGKTCNGCGVCCTLEICLIGKELFGDEQKAPCPLLKQLINKKTGEANLVCDLVLHEKANGKGSIVQELLGIGTGCDSDD